MVSSKIWFCTDSIRLMLLLHSIPPFMLHTLFLLRLSRYILLRIPFLCLILCLHLLSLSPLPHISCSIRLPSSVLTPCIVSLFTERVNSGMNVRVTVRVTFSASSPLSSYHPSCAPCGPIGPSPAPAPWLCAGNERSRHAWSGLRPGKAGRRGQAGRGGFSLDVHTSVGLGWAPEGPARGFWGMFKRHEALGELGDIWDEPM